MQVAPCKLKLRCFGLFIFISFTFLSFLSWEEWYCKTLEVTLLTLLHSFGVLPSKFCKVYKSSVLLFVFYVYLVIDCPKQKGKYVASCLMHFFFFFVGQTFSCITKLSSQRLKRKKERNYIFLVKRSGLHSVNLLNNLCHIVL